jgi:hypothetical protein
LSFTDKTLTCADCQTQFVFSAAEQEFYAKKGFTNEPKRCPACRAAKSSDLAVAKLALSDRYFPLCAPNAAKRHKSPLSAHRPPVYCSDCYSQVRLPPDKTWSGYLRAEISVSALFLF